MYRVLAYDALDVPLADLLTNWANRSRAVRVRQRSGFAEPEGWAVTWSRRARAVRARRAGRSRPPRDPRPRRPPRPRGRPRRSPRGLTPLFTAEPGLLPHRHGVTVPQIRPAGLPAEPRRHVRLAAPLHAARPLPAAPTSSSATSRSPASPTRSAALFAGSARWLGVPLGALLRENGRPADSTQLVCRSVDGMTIGAPTRSALDVATRCWPSA